MKDKKMNLSLNEQISPAYQKFFQQFSEIKEKPLSEWSLTHIIGYFCLKYKEYYNLDYTFKFNNTAPSKSYEVFQFKKLASMISRDPQVLKNYIDWIFQDKVKERKKRITSIGYLTNLDLVNDYKFKFLMQNKIDRTTKISIKYKQIIDKYNADIITYGDLAFLKKGNDYSSAKPYQKLFDELILNGFDLNILDTLK